MDGLAPRAMTEGHRNRNVQTETVSAPGRERRPAEHDTGLPAEGPIGSSPGGVGHRGIWSLIRARANQFPETPTGISQPDSRHRQAPRHVEGERLDLVDELVDRRQAVADLHAEFDVEPVDLSIPGRPAAIHASPLFRELGPFPIQFRQQGVDLCPHESGDRVLGLLRDDDLGHGSLVLSPGCAA
jgi:hypothetical protein